MFLFCLRLCQQFSRFSGENGNFFLENFHRKKFITCMICHYYWNQSNFFLLFKFSLWNICSTNSRVGWFWNKANFTVSLFFLRKSTNLNGNQINCPYRLSMNCEPIIKHYSPFFSLYVCKLLDFDHWCSYQWKFIWHLIVILHFCKSFFFFFGIECLLDVLVWHKLIHWPEWHKSIW